MEYTITADISNKKRASKARTIIATSLGNGLEMFDFTVFSFFATIIGSLYFPSDSPYNSLLMAVGVFAVGFLMRPLGSFVLGAYADRAGRKSALLITIVLMGMGTAIIALSPTYSQIGLAAPLLIVLGRLLQGFAAGGEVGASTTLLLESALPHNRGFYISWQFISQGMSSMLGAGCGSLLSWLLTPAALQSWGWRIPFLIGLLIVPVGLYIRRKVEETYVAQTHRQANDHRPIKLFFKTQKLVFSLGICIVMSCSVMTYLLLFYMPTYMIKMTNFSPFSSYLIGVISSLFLIIASFIGGLLADRWPNHRRTLAICFLVAIFLAVPNFSLLQHPEHFWLAMVARMTAVTMLGIMSTLSILMIIEAIPTSIRATGTAIIYAIGVSVFGGSAQFVVTWLIDITHNSIAPAWYLVAMLLIGLIACTYFPARKPAVAIN